MHQRITPLREAIRIRLEQARNQHATPAAMFTAIADQLAGDGWPDDLLSERDTQQTTTLPRSTRIDLIERNEFPKPFKLSPNGRRIASRSLEVEVWKVWRFLDAREAQDAA